MDELDLRLTAELQENLPGLVPDRRIGLYSLPAVFIGIVVVQ